MWCSDLPVTWRLPLGVCVGGNQRIEADLPTEEVEGEACGPAGPSDMQGCVQDVTRLEDEVAPRCRLHSRNWSCSTSIPDGDEER